MKKLNRFIPIIFSMFFLSGCYVSDGCVFAFQEVNCFKDKVGVPYIQHFQKPDTIGHTDPDQRWKDFQDCGVKNFNHGTLDINNRYPGMTSEDVTKRNKAISNCIKDKGYIVLKPSQCVDGENNRLTGLCN